MAKPIVLQIGAARDGNDFYLPACEQEDYELRVLESGRYLAYRAKSQYPHLPYTLSTREVDYPTVMETLSIHQLTPDAIVAGCEPYVYIAAEVARALGVAPYARRPFIPFNKFQQRQLLPEGLRPNWLLVDEVFNQHSLDGFHYPVVIKPIDGTNGLGVYLANTPQAVARALERLESTTNYGGTDFAGVIIEESIPGPEYSMQGVVMDGIIRILSYGRKLVFTTFVEQDLFSFREGGIALLGGQIPQAYTTLAETCLQSFGYEIGAFHIDFKASGEVLLPLETGFRPSGLGITELTKLVSGWDVPRAALCAIVGRDYQPAQPAASCVGELRLREAEEVQAARNLAKFDPEHITLTEFTRRQVTPHSKLAAEARYSGDFGVIRVQDPRQEVVYDTLVRCLLNRRFGLVY